jgi:hypothetical protein
VAMGDVRERAHRSRGLPRGTRRPGRDRAASRPLRPHGSDHLGPRHDRQSCSAWSRRARVAGPIP